MTGTGPLFPRPTARGLMLSTTARPAAPPAASLVQTLRVASCALEETGELSDEGSMTQESSEEEEAEPEAAVEEEKGEEAAAPPEPQQVEGAVEADVQGPLPTEAKAQDPLPLEGEVQDSLLAEELIAAAFEWMREWEAQGGGVSAHVVVMDGGGAAEGLIRDTVAGAEIRYLGLGKTSQGTADESFDLASRWVVGILHSMPLHSVSF